MRIKMHATSSPAVRIQPEEAARCSLMEGRAMAAEAKLAEATLAMAETERARTALEAQLGTLASEF